MINQISKKLGIIIISAVFVFSFSVVLAQDGGTVQERPASSSTSATVNTDAKLQEYSNINSPSFRLLICDGPEQLIHYDPKTNKFVNKDYINPDFVPCNFRGLMMQLQHLINIAFVLAVIASIIGLVRVGYLYISGDPGKIKKAHDIFPSILKGFVIALCAWFIIYQILVWLTGTSSYTALLGI
jgi:hypothetical protein